MWKSTNPSSLFAIIALVLASSPCKAFEFELVDLGLLPDGGYSASAFDISNGSSSVRSVAVGSASVGSITESVVFFLGATPGLLSIRGLANGISSDGLWIAGTKEMTGIYSRWAFAVGGGAAAVYIAPPVPFDWSEGNDINNNGTMVGAFSNITESHAFVYDSLTRTTTDLHHIFPHWVSSEANGVNAEGHIVGSHDWVGFIQKGHWFMDLDYTAPGCDCESQAYAINDSDVAVGSSFCIGDRRNNRIALYWKRRPTATGDGPWVAHELGSLGGFFADAKGINNREWIVGRATLPRTEWGSGGFHGFLWRNSVEGMRDLNGLTRMPPGYTIVEAKSINAQNEIVGIADYAPENEGTQPHAVLLRPLER